MQPGLYAEQKKRQSPREHSDSSTGRWWLGLRHYVQSPLDKHWVDGQPSDFKKHSASGQITSLTVPPGPTAWRVPFLGSRASGWATCRAPVGTWHRSGGAGIIWRTVFEMSKQSQNSQDSLEQQQKKGSDFASEAREYFLNYLWRTANILNTKVKAKFRTISGLMEKD